MPDVYLALFAQQHVCIQPFALCCAVYHSSVGVIPDYPFHCSHLGYFWILVTMNNAVLVILTRLLLSISVHFCIFGNGIIRTIAYRYVQLQQKLFSQKDFVKQVSMLWLSCLRTSLPTPQRPRNSQKASHHPQLPVSGILLNHSAAHLFQHLVPYIHPLMSWFL